MKINGCAVSVAVSQWPSVCVCVCVHQVSHWINEVGESRLNTLGELEDSLEQLRKKQTQFRDFYCAAYVRVVPSSVSALTFNEKKQHIHSILLSSFSSSEISCRIF